MEDELNQLRYDVRQLKQQIKNQVELFVDMAKKHDEEMKEISEEKKQLIVKNANLEQKFTDTRDLREEIDYLENQLSKEREKKGVHPSPKYEKVDDSLLKEYEALQDQNEKIEKEKAELQAKIQELVKIVAELTEKIELFESQIAQLSKALENTQRDNIRLVEENQEMCKGISAEMQSKLSVPQRSPFRSLFDELAATQPQPHVPEMPKSPVLSSSAATQPQRSVREMPKSPVLSSSAATQPRPPLPEMSKSPELCSSSKIQFQPCSYPPNVAVSSAETERIIQSKEEVVQALPFLDFASSSKTCVDKEEGKRQSKEHLQEPLRFFTTPHLLHTDGEEIAFQKKFSEDIYEKLQQSLKQNIQYAARIQQLERELITHQVPGKEISPDYWGYWKATRDISTGELTRLNKLVHHLNDEIIDLRIKNLKIPKLREQIQRLEVKYETRSNELAIIKNHPNTVSVSSLAATIPQSLSTQSSSKKTALLSKNILYSSPIIRTPPTTPKQKAPVKSVKNGWVNKLKRQFKYFNKTYRAYCTRRDFGSFPTHQ